MKRGRGFWGGSGLILVAAICFGFQSSLIKKLFLLGSNPFQVIFYELALASLVLGAVSLALRSRVAAMTPREAGRVLLWGAIGVGGTGLGLYGAVQRLPVALAIVLLFSYLPWVFLLEFLFLRIRPSLKRWSALGLILAGTALATGVLAVPVQSLDSPGILMGLAGGVCYGTFIFAARPLGGLGTPLRRSFVICGGTCLLFALAGLFRPDMVFLPPREDLGAFVTLLVTVTFLGQIIPLLAFSRGIPVIGGSLAAIIASVELPVASLVAVLLLGEALLPTQWGGVFLITLGVVVANWRQRELAQVPPPPR